MTARDPATGAPTRPAKAIATGTLGVIVAATLVTLTVGALVKQPCASGTWSDGRQYKRLCYTDIVPLYATEHLDGNRLPYIDKCPDAPGQQCDEYPVLTMYFMRAAAWISNGISGSSNAFGTFFWTNVALLALLGLVTAGLLWTVAGERALFFAVAPTLLVYSFVNWDLLAVALATAGTVFYLKNRNELAGTMLGLGAAAKLYPALLLVPFVLGRFRQRRRGGAANLVVWAVVAWAAVNIPFAVASGHEWGNFFRFNANRGLDWDSLWFVSCEQFPGSGTCPWLTRAIHPRIGLGGLHLSIPGFTPINALSVLILAAVVAILHLVRRSRDPDFPRWTLAFPLLVTFLLTSKVYSPQYSLWLIPWFVLALPSLPLFVAFEITDVAVFITRFGFFGTTYSLDTFQIMLVLRALVLLACLVAWAIRRDERVVVEEAPPALAPRTPDEAPSSYGAIFDTR